MKTITEPSLCPLCGHANDCQLCTTEAYKGPCWCQEASIPQDLLARVPAAQRNQACICRTCVQAYHREVAASRPAPRVVPGDFYFENGLLVFTAAYLRRRGYCCGSNCRHCPYGGERPTLSSARS